MEQVEAARVLQPIYEMLIRIGVAMERCAGSLERLDATHSAMLEIQKDVSKVSVDGMFNSLGISSDMLGLVEKMVGDISTLGEE